MPESVRRPGNALLLLSLGHVVVDASAGFFPMYVAMRHLDLVQAGVVMTVSGMASNFAQPFFGFLSDRMAKVPIPIGLRSPGC